MASRISGVEQISARLLGSLQKHYRIWSARGGLQITENVDIGFCYPIKFELRRATVR